MPVLLIFLLLPLVEIALFVLVGGWLGLWPTLGLVVASGFLGVTLVRRQGGATLRRVQHSMRTLGEDPTTPLAHGAMIVLAGLLLALPGFFSDALALPLLVPPLRRLILAALARRVVTVRAATVRWPDARDDVIDAEATEITPDAHPLPRSTPSGWTRPPE